MLLAIELKDVEKKECNIAINPGSNTIIQPQTQGFFIAQSADEVKRFVLMSECRNYFKILIINCQNPQLKMLNDFDLISFIKISFLKIFLIKE